MKEKIMLILVQTRRQTFFKTIAIGSRDHTHSKHSKGSWGFIAEEQCERVHGWKTTKRRQG